MIDDLTMLANLPVLDAEVAAKAGVTSSAVHQYRQRSSIHQEKIRCF